MADDKIQEKESITQTVNNQKELIVCSKCKRVLSPGERYVELVLTDEIICLDCDEGFFDGDILQSIE